MPPVIFLAFANSKDAYLDGLEGEQKAISEALRPHRDSNRIALETSFSTTVADIFNAFTRYKDRIAVLHYAGHADGAHLELRDGLAVGQGLADLIRVQGNKPELVVLNGCATGGQVQALQDAGVKAVIATSVPINDAAAHTFAGSLYRSLAAYCTVQEAFDTAIAELTMRGKQPVRVHRSLYWEGKDGEGSDPAIWGLFGESDWRIPEAIDVPLETLDLDLKTLVNPVFREMLDTYNYGREIGNAEKSLRPQLMRQALIKAFPLPIGRELEVLFQTNSREQVGEQIQRMALTYLRITQLHAYILLSQAWDAVVEGKFRPDDTLRTHIRNFAALQQDGWRMFRYDLLAETLEQTLTRNGIALFVPTGNNREAYLAACEYFAGIRPRLLNATLSAGQGAALFNTAAAQLAALLQYHAAMVDNISLVSVKDVVVQRTRGTREVLFRQNISTLAKVVKEGTVFGYVDQPAPHADSFSVLLGRYDSSKTRIVGSLNLSPLMMDTNAFESQHEKSQIPRLMLYAYAASDGSRYYEDTQEKQHVFVRNARLHNLTAQTVTVPDEDDMFGDAEAESTENVAFALPTLLVRQFQDLVNTFAP